MEQLIALVKKTESILLDENFSRDYQEKGLADYVTKVDILVEQFLKKELLSHYPNTAFMGEEEERPEILPEVPLWILDPVDGTTNLMHQYQMSAVSLALCVNHVIEKGIVYNPFTKELFYAKRGQGAYLNGKPIHVTNTAELSESLIAIGTSPYEKERADRLFSLFQKIYMQSQDIRRSGSAALDLCYLAAGRIDGYLEQNLKPWDFAAGALILEEAGGIVTNWSGKKIDYYHNSDILAGTNHNYKHLLEMVME